MRDAGPVRQMGGGHHDAVSTPAGPCILPFLRLRAAASRWTGRYSPAGSMKNSRSQSATPRACCNRLWVRTEGLRSPRIRCERYPAEMPLRRANSFRDMPSWSSSSHTATGLSFTLDREGHFRFNAACFLPSVSVPSVARTTGASASGRLPRPLQRRAFVVVFRWWPCQSEYAAPFSFQPGPSAMRARSSFALRAELRAMTGLLLRPRGGQHQLVGQLPAVSGADGSSAAQPLIPATGPPGCRCGTSGRRSLVPCSLMALIR